MWLYFVDNEEDQPIAARARVKNDEEAEKHVKDNAVEPNHDKLTFPLVRFLLVDDDGIRCVWTRTPEQARAHILPAITRVSDRYKGRWTHLVTERSQILFPQSVTDQLILDNYEHIFRGRDSRS